MCAFCRICLFSVGMVLLLLVCILPMVGQYTYAYGSPEMFQGTVIRGVYTLKTHSIIETTIVTWSQSLTTSIVFTTILSFVTGLVCTITSVMYPNNNK